MSEASATEAALLRELCSLCGIAPAYADIWGERRETTPETARAVLSAMGVASGSESELRESLEALHDEEWRRHLPPAAVVRSGAHGAALPLALPDARLTQPLRWKLMREDGGESEAMIVPVELERSAQRDVDGAPWSRVVLAVPLPPEGYHRLAVFSEGEAPTVATRLIVVPATCFMPNCLEEGGRVWGLTAQLHGLRSRRNWGAGDFTDLVRVAAFAGQAGGDFVGVNPLHAPAGEDDPGLYSPSSRSFLNPLYIDPEAIPDFAECEPAAARVSDDAFRARLARLRGSELLRFGEVGRAKHELFELLCAHFREHHREDARGRAFDEFRREGGRALERFSLYEALREHLQREDAAFWGWPVWPERYRDPDSDAVREFAEAHRERLEYHQYLQWNARLQLGAADAGARAAGCRLGLYTDLALSANAGGADTWRNRPLYAMGVHLGAPPDDFNARGQDWGLPPWIPRALQAAAYEPFIAALRANMRDCGALRIDHAMALMRSFWVPAGEEADQGAYVHYPLADLIGILALESRRNECLVIGEDLGTVPPELREALGEAGVLSYRVLYFEKEADGSFRAPADYERRALAVVSTHDLPTLAGYWQGRDIALKTELELYPDDAMREQQVLARAEDRARLVMALAREDLLPPGFAEDPLPPPEMTPALARAIHAWLARTASAITGVQLEDMLGETEQANLPGTVDEHPNWRRKLPVELEAWDEDEDVAALLAAMRRERPRPAGDAAPASRAAAAAGETPDVEIPRATYRLQLNAGFGFRQAAAIVPYLDALGVSHCYCSPYLMARPGSRHGYDIVDHSRLNPEIGGREDFEVFHRALEAQGMGHILDMVPNHMAVMGSDNGWWLDVLENGPASEFADFFDIDWRPPKDELRGKLLVPVLGDHYGSVLERGELTLVFEAEAGTFHVEYFEHRLPIDPREYGRILGPDLAELRRALGEAHEQLLALESLIAAFGKLPPRHDRSSAARAERSRDRRLHCARLAELAGGEAIVGDYVASCVEAVNGEGSGERERLHALMEAQAWRIAYWRMASEAINYRRFFDINELASLRMENAEVFEATHGLVLDLIAGGRLQGLRIDHPDGLYDPGAYFRRLQRRIAERGGKTPEDAHTPALYVVAEKILHRGETLPEDWPIHGTTGYELGNLIDRLLVFPEGADRLRQIWFRFTGGERRYEDVVYEAKRLIMRTALASELNVLAAGLDRIAEADPRTRDFGLGGLRNALVETIACFPVYRTYASDGEMSGNDRGVVEQAIAAARRRSEAADESVFDFLREVLLMSAASGKPEPYRSQVRDFVMRFQQYTGPVTAKGMEDTGFYRYNPLVSLNEVGGTPDHPGVGIEDFHAENLARRKACPHAMLAGSTHDSKRSEDVRARIHVLSELPEAWRERLRRWSMLNADCRRRADGVAVPDPDTEYLLYQTLLGAWPRETREAQAPASFTRRICDYMTKAVREAKRHTSWMAVRPDYENALHEFVERILDPARSRAFLEDFLSFHRTVARAGLLNSLVQTALRLTLPGVPDIYQGNETWRFDLVDPDNRRGVDFERRAALLRALQEDYERAPGALVETLGRSPDDDRAKLFLTWRLLRLRRQYPTLFAAGGYTPLRVHGVGRERICAFGRSHRGTTLVVAVSRWHVAEPASGGEIPARWPEGDATAVELPRGFAPREEALARRALSPGSGTAPQRVEARDLFTAFPVALILGE